MKTLYIIPGWGQKLSDYDWLKKSWQIKTINYNQFNPENCLDTKNLKDFKGKGDVVLGFSVGALIASRLPFKKKILISPSAFLDGDLQKYPAKDLEDILNKEQIKNLSKLKYRPQKNVSIVLGRKEKDTVAQKRWADNAEKWGALLVWGNFGHKITKSHQKIILDFLEIA